MKTRRPIKSTTRSVLRANKPLSVRYAEVLRLRQAIAQTELAQLRNHRSTSRK